MVGCLVLYTFGDSLDRISPFNLLIHLDNDFATIAVDLSRDKGERYLGNVHSWNVENSFSLIFFTFGK